MNRFKNFDKYVKDAMLSWHCPGVALAVVKGDKVLHQNVYGLRDVENHLPMTEDTRFAMASVTKSFTAMSVALLADEGKLEWDKPVREYMPEFILNDPYVTQHVTVRDMLSHRTGLPRHDFSAWRLDVSRDEFIKRMRYLKFNATFREKFQYNNLMYIASAYLVEKIAGQKWEDFVQERIFSPLRMEASNFKPHPPQEGQVNALGYRVDRDNEGGARDLIGMPFGLYTEISPGAAGALFSTLADLTQWLKVHVNNGRAGNLQLISPDNLKQMHLPQTIRPGGGFYEALLGNTIFTYGMGWFVEPYKGFTLVHHGGNLEGHSLIIGFVPQERIGVIALTNIAMLPLRDVLLYEGIDRALNLPDRNWNTKFHEMFDPIIIGEAKAKQTAADEKLSDAPPTHPLNTYSGTFATDGYPDFAVRTKGEGLQACTVGSLDWSELRHYHYDVFEWHIADFNFWIKVRFLVNDNGDVDSVSIPIEPEIENLIFTRKRPELTDDLIAELVGIYDPPVDGVEFTITAHKGKIYAAQTGNPPKELIPYKLSDNLVGFKMDRSRLDFLRENDVINRLVWKSFSMTLEAPKKE
ncbi:MAG: serine hydrolase [Calditrichaeota bacterium]|nr:serine hydrolase [Calditrichota bacterium]